ncbi:hypothetical protein T4A_11491 [Trichinella pseudospiralis]|nr:hypothetical protein T4A_11491 [Trichinella pseudospiralis]
MKRSALVKTAAGTLVRSIRKLQLIEPAATYSMMWVWAMKDVLDYCVCIV